MQNAFAIPQLRLRYALLLVLYVLCSYWIFIDTYRINAFNIVPHDDYAPYLLYILGQEGGVMPGAPFAYRILSVVVAVPFYFVVPVYNFTLLGFIDESYMRAVGALALVSYLAMLLSGVMTYLITTIRFSGSRAAGAIGALLCLLAMHFSGYKGVDPVGILIIFLLVFYSKNMPAFVILIFMSIGFNEKIALITAIVMFTRFAFRRRREELTPALAAAAAFLLYIGIRSFWTAPGNEQQLQFASFLSNAISNISDLITLKRLVLDLLPVGMLAIMYTFAAYEYRRDRDKYRKFFAMCDVSALLGIFLVTILIDIRYNVGRISMYCLPFLLPLASIGIERELRSNPDGN